MSDATTAAALPLESLHRRLGGRLADDPGRQGVADYGAPAAEHRALAEGAALVDRSFRDRLELAGADRQRFLNGLVTSDVKALEPGRGAYGFFPSAQGKILADTLVLAFDDRFWLELPAGLGEAIAAHLARYVIVDQVEIRGLEGQALLALAGPAAEEALRAFGGPPVERFAHAVVAIAGVEARVVRQPLAGGPAFSLWVPVEGAEAVAEALLARPGVVPAGHDALERLRVERGVPAFGADFGPDHFPQETGLEDVAVSYAKGCYLGQEVIARIHYRGKANRAARRVLFAGGVPPAPGTPLLQDGEEIGRVGSSATAGDGRALGIAVLHRKANEAGTRLEVAGGGEAEVADLPPDLIP